MTSESAGEGGLPLAVAIRAPAAEDWAAWFLRRAADRNPMARRWFASDDELYSSDARSIGRYRFVDAEVMARAFAGATWPRLAAPCPFVGDVAGFLTWTWWPGQPPIADRRHDVELFLAAGNGFVVRTDELAGFDLVVERTFELREATDPHGFDDGAFFLDLEGELADRYARHVREAIERALDEIGVAARPTIGDSPHNPHRYHLVPRAGESHDAVAERFRRHERRPLTLWGYAPADVRGPALSALVADPPA